LISSTRNRYSLIRRNAGLSNFSPPIKIGSDWPGFPKTGVEHVALGVREHETAFFGHWSAEMRGVFTYHAVWSLEVLSLSPLIPLQT